MTGLDGSRREGGADVLASAADLYIALGSRMRERPDARWMVEMHPVTRTDFDLEAFNERFGADGVPVYVSRYVAPGEYRLLRRGFGSGGDGAPDDTDFWPRSTD